MEIRVRYSEALIKRVARRFWARQVGWQGFTAVAALTAFVVYLIAQGDRSWYVSALATLLVVSLAVGTAAYRAYRARALATLRRMSDPTATIVLGDSGFSSRSDLGGGDLSWRAVDLVWAFPEAWLIFVAKDTFVTIPTENLTDGARDLIRAKVREHGGRIVGLPHARARVPGRHG